jgi:hypothetical protein
MQDRVLTGTAPTISATFYVDGVATDPAPATATVEILREDGTTLVAAGTNAPHAGTGVFTYALTASQTAQLDLLTARWTATVGGQLQTIETFVEVVGGFMFSLAQARRLSPLGDTAAYPTSDLLAYRTLAEQALEEACGVAFVPRYARDLISGDARTDVAVRRRPLSVLSASIDGTALTSPELSVLALYPSGRIYRTDPANPSLVWPAGHENIVVKYTHGYRTCPGRESRAALLLARRWLVESPLDDRTTRVVSEGGMAEFAIVDEDLFDLPELNAVVRRHRRDALRLA